MPKIVGYQPGSGDPIYRLSKLEFRWRYTIEEQVAIDIYTDTTQDPVERSTLRVLAASLAEAEDIDPDDPRTQQGVQYHASLGLIAPERPAEILAPITP